MTFDTWRVIIYCVQTSLMFQKHVVHCSATFRICNCARTLTVRRLRPSLHTDLSVLWNTSRFIKVSNFARTRALTIKPQHRALFLSSRSLSQVMIPEIAVIIPLEGLCLHRLLLFRKPHNIYQLHTINNTRICFTSRPTWLMRGHAPEKT